jgi:hypothetical protein
VQLTFNFDVLFAVGVKLLAVLNAVVPIRAGRVFTGTRLPRPGHLPHVLVFGLLVLQLQHRSDSLQLGRQRQRLCRGHSAAVTLDRHKRPAIARGQNVRFNRAFERIVMRADEPIRIVGSFNEFLRDGIAGHPQLHRPVVDGVGAAPQISRRVGGVYVHAHC